MNILVDSAVNPVVFDITDSAHKIIKLDLTHKPSMPYDLNSKSVIAQWIYSKAVDKDVDIVILKDVELCNELNKYDICAISLH